MRFNLVVSVYLCLIVTSIKADVLGTEDNKTTVSNETELTTEVPNNTTQSEITVTTELSTNQTTNITDSSTSTITTTVSSSTSQTTETTVTIDVSTGESKSTTAPTTSGGFNALSFIGGIVLTVGLLAIVYVGFKFYKARTERNYHTL